MSIDIRNKVDKEKLKRWTDALKGFHPLKKDEMIAKYSDRLTALKELNDFVQEVTDSQDISRTEVVQILREVQRDILGYQNYNDIKDTAIKQLIRYVEGSNIRIGNKISYPKHATDKLPTNLKTFEQGIKDDLKILANFMNLKYIEEYPVSGGKIDVVLAREFSKDIQFPIFGIEIETSWRTRKHLKGDIFNLTVLKPMIGIMLFVEKGFQSEEKLHDNIKATKKMLKAWENHIGIIILMEDDIKKLRAFFNLKS